MMPLRPLRVGRGRPLPGAERLRDDLHQPL